MMHLAWPSRAALTALTMATFTSMASCKHTAMGSHAQAAGATECGTESALIPPLPTDVPSTVTLSQQTYINGVLGSKEKTVTLKFLGKGCVGSAYEYEGDDGSRKVVKIPYSDRIGMFQQELQFFETTYKNLGKEANPDIRAFATFVIPTRTITVIYTGSDGKEVKTESLLKPFLDGTTLDNADQTAPVLKEQLDRMYVSMKAAFQEGYYFWDVKDENMMVDTATQKIRLIDAMTPPSKPPVGRLDRWFIACNAWPWCKERSANDPERSGAPVAAAAGIFDNTADSPDQADQSGDSGSDTSRPADRGSNSQSDSHPR